MMNKVRKGPKAALGTGLRVVFLVLMALFAAVPLLQVLLNSFLWVCQRSGCLIIMGKPGI